MEPKILRVKVSKDKQEKTKDCLFGNETHYNWAWYIFRNWKL